MIDVALRSLILTHASTLVEDRVQPSTETVLVAEALPRVLYSLIDIDRSYTDSGRQGIAFARYQIDVYADKQSQARAVFDAILNGLDGYRGTLDGTVILRVSFGGEKYAAGEKVEGRNNTLARQVGELFIAYRD